MGWLKMEENLENFEKQDENLEKLRRIGIDKIKQDTKLDAVKISDILEKRFEKLDYVRARGFINILEKQYKLDLSTWLEEYRQYFPKEKDEKREKLEKQRYNQTVKQKRLALILITLILCIVFLYVGQMLWNRKNEFFKPIDQFQEIKDKEKQILSQDEVLKKEQQDEASLQASASESTSANQNNAVEPKQVEKPLSQLDAPLFDGLSFDPENILYLSFQKPVWMGIVNLDKKSRVAQTKREFEVALDTNLLFYIAYGVFTATVNENEKQFNTYKPIFLIHTKEGGLRQITKEEFISLNGGVEW